MKINTKTYKLKDINIDLAKSIALKYNVKEEDIDFVRKGLPLEKADVDNDAETGTMYISTKHTDRDGDIVVPSGIILDDYRKTPVVLWCHKYSMDDVPVGMNLWTKVDSKGVLAKTKYHTRPGTIGEKVYNYLKDGFPLACSIGFAVLESKSKDEFNEIDTKKLGLDDQDVKNADRIYTKTLLMEYSLVPVASNSDSVVLSMKGFGINVEDELEYQLKDIEIIDPFKGDSDGKQKETTIEEIQKAEESGTSDSISVEEKEINSEIIEEKSEIDELFENISDEIDDGDSDTQSKSDSSIEEVSPIDEILKSIENEEETEVKSEEIVDKFCDCEIFEGDDDICKGCGGKRKPKKSYYEDIIKEYSKIIPDLKKKAIEEHKKGIETKLYDVSSVPSSTPSRKMKIYCKFLECQIKDIYQNEFLIPLILNGAYLAGFKSKLSNYKEIDVRNFSNYDYEYPPTYEVLKINSKLEDDFLINGQSFYDFGGIPVVLDFYPSYYGQVVCVSSSRKYMDTNKNFIKSVHEWVEKENPLKNEKFSLNKDFIDVDSSDSWETILLDPKNTKVMKITEKTIKEKDNFAGRGILLVGPPGTGKTKVSRILMTQTDKTFIWVSSKDLQNDWYVNDKIALGFKLARQLAPTILLFEDIDNWITGKIVDLFKTELDGLKKNTGVVTILTTNNPEKLPDALLDRPGRFHDVLEFGYPSKDIRSQMIKNWLGEIDEKTLDTLLESTENYSGAHMWELIEFAKSIAEDEEIDIKDAILQSLEKLNDQKELINTIRGKSVEIVETKDLDSLLSEITDENIPKEFEIEIEEKEFPLEIVEKEIEFTDEEIATMVFKVMQERPKIDVDSIVKESILKLKGRMY